MKQQYVYGLADRLARIDEIHSEEDTPADRARIARREFSSARQTSMTFES